MSNGHLLQVNIMGFTEILAVRCVKFGPAMQQQNAWYDQQINHYICTFRIIKFPQVPILVRALKNSIAMHTAGAHLSCTITTGISRHNEAAMVWWPNDQHPTIFSIPIHLLVYPSFLWNEINVLEINYCLLTVSNPKLLVQVHIWLVTFIQLQCVDCRVCVEIFIHLQLCSFHHQVCDDINATLSQWEPWSECTASCGRGIRKRCERPNVNEICHRLVWADNSENLEISISFSFLPTHYVLYVP